MTDAVTNFAAYSIAPFVQGRRHLRKRRQKFDTNGCFAAGHSRVRRSLMGRFGELARSRSSHPPGAEHAQSRPLARQATSDGLALELTVKGKKYYKSTTRMPISTDTSHTRWIKPRERVMHPGDRDGAETVAARPFASSESSLTSCSAEVPTA